MNKLPQKRKITPAPSPLVAELTGHGVNETPARQLVAEYDQKRIRLQLEVLNWRESKKPGRISDPAAWLVVAVKNGHSIPNGFVSKADLQKAEEARRSKARDEEHGHSIPNGFVSKADLQKAEEARRSKARDEERRRKQQAAAQERADSAALRAYLKPLGKAQRAGLEAEALAAAGEDIRKTYQNPAMTSVRKMMMKAMLREYLMPILRRQPPAKP